MKLITVIKYLLLEQKNKLLINDLFSFFIFFIFYIFFIDKSVNLIVKLINSFVNAWGLTSFLNFISLFIFLNWFQIGLFNFRILIKEILDNNLATNILHFPISTALIFHFKSFKMFINLSNWINHLFVSMPLIIATATLLKAGFYKSMISILMYFLLDYSINAISIISIILIIKIISKPLIEFIFFCFNCLYSLSFATLLIIFIDKKFIGIEIYNYISYLFNSHYITLIPSKWLINIIASNNFWEMFLNSSVLLIFSVIVLYICTYIFNENFDGFFYVKNYTIQRNTEFSKTNNKFMALLNLEIKILYNFNTSIIYTSIYFFIMFILAVVLKYKNDKLLPVFFILCYITGMISTLVTSKTEKNQILVYQIMPISFIHVYLSKLFVSILLNYLIALIMMSILYILNCFTAFSFLYLSFVIGLIVILVNLFLLDVGLYFQKNSRYNSDFIAVIYLILFVTAYLWSFNFFIFFVLLTFLCQCEIRLRIFKEFENGEFI